MGDSDRILFNPPAEWPPFAVALPDLPEGSDVAVDSWAAWGRASGPRAVSGCLGMDLGAWTDEASPFALERLTATVGATAAKLTGVGSLHASSTTSTGNVTTQSLLGTGDAEGKLTARTFVGFTSTASPRIEACFVLCAPTSKACEASLEQAAPGSAFVKPPATSAPLEVIVAMVHHPLAVAISAAALCVALAVVAIATRARPRTK